jgi:speckle-type POZ protein
VSDRVSVILKDSNTLTSHKLILCARSPVFKAMLTSGLSESTSNEIVISDFEPEVVHAFLKFLYSDKCSTLEQHSFALYQMADKYQVNSLKITCERH